MLNMLRQENAFNLNRTIVLDDEYVLDVLNSDTIDISRGYYDIEEDDEKIRVNFGYINL